MQRLLDVIGNPFDGEDVVVAVSAPDALAGLRTVFDPLVAEGFVTAMVPESGFGQERVGIEGFLAAWQNWAAPWDSLRFEVNEVADAGDNLLTVVEQLGVPKGGSREVKQRAAAVWKLADGTLARAEFHIDVDAARRSAGLAG